MKQHLELTQHEKVFYEQVWSHALTMNPNQLSDEIISKVAAHILSLSKLPKEHLRTIWKMSTSQETFMTKSEFFFSLKLVALKQNYIQINEENIRLFTVLPKLEKLEFKAKEEQKTVPKQNQVVFEIKEETIKRIENYIESKCKTKRKGVLEKSESMELFNNAAQLNPQEQSQLWNICDLEQKGFLNRGQFIVALYLISLCKNNVPIPSQMPQSLLEFLQQYNKKRPSVVNTFDKEHQIEYEKKFEGMMNLLLKTLYDQESKLKEYSSTQESIINSQEQEIKGLQDLFNQLNDEEEKQRRQNNLLTSLSEMMCLLYHQNLETTAKNEDFSQKDQQNYKKLLKTCQDVLENEKRFDSFVENIHKYVEGNQSKLITQASLQKGYLSSNNLQPSKLVEEIEKNMKKELETINQQDGSQQKGTPRKASQETPNKVVNQVGLESPENSKTSNENDPNRKEQMNEVSNLAQEEENEEEKEGSLQIASMNAHDDKSHVNVEQIKELVDIEFHQNKMDSDKSVKSEEEEKAKDFKGTKSIKTQHKKGKQFKRADQFQF